MIDVGNLGSDDAKDVADAIDEATESSRLPKFCQQCGEKLTGGKFCPSCGASVSGGGRGGDSAGGDGPKKPKLWNPNAVANWSLLFTPIFGSYLNRQNWLQLGEKGRAQGSFVWFWISIVVVAVVAISPEFPPASILLYLFIWYFLAGKPQADYVSTKVGGNYDKKGWSGPVVSGLGIFFGLFILFVGMEDYVSGSSWGQVPACDSRIAQKLLNEAFDKAQFARIHELSAVVIENISESSFNEEINTRSCTADITLNNAETISVRYELEVRERGELMLTFEAE